jgi:uncharacterized protein (TIGR02246 family)
VPASPRRPTLDPGGDAAARARAAVEAFVAELQEGLYDTDAEIYNRHFAADVIWGGPFGATLAGYEPLHAIHARFHRERRLGPSRYEVVQVLVPAERVAVAHVRRVALDQQGEPIDPADAFTEMALYVLVERDGEWWLAAGQNTPVRPGMSATD